MRTKFSKEISKYTPQLLERLLQSQGERGVSKIPIYAYNYAKYKLNGRFKKGEDAILTSPTCTLLYMKDVVGKWARGEQIIIKSGCPKIVYEYTRDVLNRRFERGESILLTNAEYALAYSRDILKRRWIEAEWIISQSPSLSYWYARDIIKGRFELGESAIAQEAYPSYWYARDVIKGRFVAGEKTILENLDTAVDYAEDVINGRWVEAEPRIAKCGSASYWYAAYVVKGRFELGETAIMDTEFAQEYLDTFLSKHDWRYDGF